MLATANELVAALSLSRTNAKHAAWVALADIVAPLADRLVKKYVGSEVEQGTFTEYYPLISTRPSMSQGYVEDDDMLAWEGSPQGARPIRQGRGNSRDTISVQNLPLRSVSSIYENPSAWIDASFPTGYFAASHLLTAARDYHVDWDGLDGSGAAWSKTGMVFRVGAIWSLQARSVKIAYTGGYTAGELADTYTEFRAAGLMTGIKLFNEMKALSPAAQMGGTGIIIGESKDDYSVTYQPAGKPPSILMEDLPQGAKMMLEAHRRMSQFI